MGVAVGGAIVLVLVGVAELTIVGVLVGVAVGVGDFVGVGSDPPGVAVGLGVSILPCVRPLRRQATFRSCGETTGEDGESFARE
ncbi:MAG: hypothetical protein ABSG55_01190 [Dehalococcoidia bacterium]